MNNQTQIWPSTRQVKPFIKWAGGKGQLLKAIQKEYPKGLGTRYTKYAEPFIGGGAVLFDLLNKFTFKQIYISDVNRELINTYKTIRDSVDTLISLLQVMQDEYVPANEDKRKEYFYAKRDRFNEIKVKDSLRNDAIECAALFIFLNKTCFNGLYRVNGKGLYNVPMGKYKNPLICDADNLAAISEKLQNVVIVNGDFRQSDGFIDDDTFAYFDPPYRPLTDTASFTSYTKDGFTDKDQEDLAHLVATISKRGAKAVVSNSDPKNVDESDNFFDTLYAPYKIWRVGATRAINSKASSRGRISELLIAT
jgi:DNA adenine methylase